MEGLSLPRLSFSGSRFLRWRGVSGRDYVVSVYPIGKCPDYTGAVVIAVDSRSGRRVWVGDSGGGGRALAEKLSAAKRQGADEAHLHLLAATAAGREEVIADLRGD